MWVRSAALVISREREGQYEIPFSTLLTNSWQGMYLWNHLWMACIHSRCAGGEVEVAQPLHCHHSTSMLSVRDRIVCYRRS